MSILFQPKLLPAIFRGNYWEVEEILSNSNSRNISDGEKRTPLHAAAYAGVAKIAGKVPVHHRDR